MSGYLVRIDDPRTRTHGIQARCRARRVKRRGKWIKAYRSKFFADRKHGGESAAMAKARTWLATQEPTP